MGPDIGALELIQNRYSSEAGYILLSELNFTVNTYIKTMCSTTSTPVESH